VASMDVPADTAAVAESSRATVVKPTYITWMTLAFMTTASVASLRSAPTMGGALILQTYCPEKLQEFKEKTQDLKTDDVIKG
jgi:hypothetical protein